MGRWDGSKFSENKRRKEFLLIGLAGGAGVLAIAALGVAKKGGGGSGNISGTLTSPHIPYASAVHTLSDTVFLYDTAGGEPKFVIGTGKGYISAQADGAQGGAPSEIAMNSPSGGAGMSVGLNVGGDLDINANAGRVALISGTIDVFVDGNGNAIYPVPADIVAFGGSGAGQHWGVARIRGSNGVEGYAPNSTSREWTLTTGSGLGFYANAGDSEFAVNLFTSGSNGALRFGPGGATPADVFVERNSGNLRFFAGSNRIQWDGSVFGPSTVDATFDLGSPALRWRDVYSSSSYKIISTSGAANPTTRVTGQEIDFGAGGASATDVTIQRAGSGGLTITTASTMTLNVNSGSSNLNFNGFEFNPNSDNASNLGNSAKRWSSIVGNNFKVFGTVSDTNPKSQLIAGELDFGPGGASATDNSIKRSAANSLNIDSTIFPNTDNSRNIGGAGNRWNVFYSSGSYNILGAANDANPTSKIDSGRLQFGPGGATAMDLSIRRGGPTDFLVNNNWDSDTDGGANLGIATQRWKDLYMSGKVKAYNGITPVAFGVPLIVAEGDLTGQTGTVASVTAYTVGAANGVFKVGGDLDVTAFTSGTINLQVTYTDWNSGAQTITIDTATALADFLGNEVTIMAKASTSITIKTTGTFTATYSVAATIIQVK